MASSKKLYRRRKYEEDRKCSTDPESSLAKTMTEPSRDMSNATVDIDVQHIYSSTGDAFLHAEITTQHGTQTTPKPISSPLSSISTPPTHSPQLDFEKTKSHDEAFSTRWRFSSANAGNNKINVFCVVDNGKGIINSHHVSSPRTPNNGSSSPSTTLLVSSPGMSKKKQPGRFQNQLYIIIIVLLFLLYPVGLMSLRLNVGISELDHQMSPPEVPYGWRRMVTDFLQWFSSTEQAESAVIDQEQHQLGFQTPDTSNNDNLRVLFYHIYLPKGDSTNALRIVQEQLQQIANHTLPGKQTLILYNTVKAQNVLTPGQMNEWCDKFHLQCQHLQHFNSGGEGHTLQMVHEFCHEQPATYRIGYLHNKGSYHSNPVNTKWRRLMTHAIMQDDCWPPVFGKNDESDGSSNHNISTSNMCNVCGLYYTFDRGLYMAGNFWTSTCGYIQQLINPRYFEANMSALVANASDQAEKYGRFGYTQYPQEPPFLGTERYAAEWWIGSHPAIEPCDYSGNIPDGVGFDRTKQFLRLVRSSSGLTMDYNWAFVSGKQFPGQPYKFTKPKLYHNEKMEKDPDYWKKEYFLLPGMVFRWIHLYQQLPSASSWIWTHYPHGDRWLHAVQKYGLDVMDRILEDKGSGQELQVFRGMDQVERAVMEQKKLDTGSIETGQVELAVIDQKQHQNQIGLPKLDTSSHETGQVELSIMDQKQNQIGLPKLDTSKNETSQVEQVSMDQKQHQVDFWELNTTYNDNLRVLFYHIYLPQGDSTDALRIVQEQLQQIANHTPPGKQTLILYNTVNAQNVLTPGQMNEWCDKLHLQCRHLQHFDTGAEELTLQMVHEFCQQQPATYRIGYLHNKGSYHPSRKNKNWRRLMTHAIMRDDCWPPVIGKNDESHPTNGTSNMCNVCGLYFTFDRGLFMAGNFWTSTCGYIQQLFEPRYFGTNMSAVEADASDQALKYGRFGYTQYPRQSEFLGTGRYAAEWWIGSHPTIEPCDYSGSIPKRSNYDRTTDFLDLVWGAKGLNMDKRWTFASGKQFPGLSYRLPKKKLYLTKKMEKDPDYWKKEYFLLPGMVFRWIHLYQQLPSASSWVWRHYPHGDRWLRAVQKYGMDVMDRILEDKVSFEA